MLLDAASLGRRITWNTGGFSSAGGVPAFTLASVGLGATIPAGLPANKFSRCSALSDIGYVIPSMTPWVFTTTVCGIPLTEYALNIDLSVSRLEERSVWKDGSMCI